MKPSLQLSNTEQKMLEEVFGIFEKYKYQTRRFGVQLVHSHFPLKKGEILLETHDKKNRTLSVTPLRVANLKIMPKATAWKKSSKGMQITMLCCDNGGITLPPIR